MLKLKKKKCGMTSKKIFKEAGVASENREKIQNIKNNG